MMGSAHIQLAGQPCLHVQGQPPTRPSLGFSSKTLSAQWKDSTASALVIGISSAKAGNQFGKAR
jgi:hypothetical protein